MTEKFSNYLHGSYFVVFTDNNPLTYVLTTAKLDATGFRWIAALAQYSFELRYKKGSENTDADALSRIEWTEESAAEVQASMNRACTETPAVLTVAVSKAALAGVEPRAEDREARWTPRRWAEEQRRDPDLAAIAGNHPITGRDPYAKERRRIVQGQAGVLLRTAKDPRDGRPLRQVLVPTSLKSKILEMTHDEQGHLGRDRVLAALRERFWWPGLEKDVRRHLQECQRCLKFKQAPENPPLQPICGKTVFELVHIDFLHLRSGPSDLPRKELLMVVTDHFTRFAQVFVTPNETAYTVAKTLWESYFNRFGFPAEILTDQGPAFTSQLVTELCELTGTIKRRTTAYHPQTNGACERFNSTLLNMLGTLEQTQKAEWKKHLTTLVHAYNCSRSSVTGYSPFELFYGRPARLPLDVEFGLFRAQDGHQTLDAKGYLRGLREQLQEAFDRAEAAERQTKRRAKERYDRKAKACSLAPGDEVLLHALRSSKICDRWESDTYEVVERITPSGHVYRIKPVGRDGPLKTVNRQKLYPLRLLGRTESEQEPTPPLQILKREERDSTDAIADLPAGGDEQPHCSSDRAPRPGPKTRSQTRELDVAVAGMKALRERAGMHPPAPDAERNPAKEEDEVD